MGALTDRVKAITEKDGGATFSADTLDYVDTGSAWCVGNGQLAILEAPGNIIDYDELWSFVVGRSTHGLIGTWLNDDKLYIDSVALIDDIGEAVRLADANGEKAIYQASTGRTITLR